MSNIKKYWTLEDDFSPLYFDFLRQEEVSLGHSTCAVRIEDV